MEKKSAAEERIKRLEETIARKKAELVRTRGLVSERERKARLRRLIHIGALVEIAELDGADEGFLLGLFLSGKEIPKGTSEWKRLKNSGDAILKEREGARVVKADKG